MLDREKIDLAPFSGTVSRNPTSTNLLIEETAQDIEKDKRKQRKRKRGKSQNDTNSEITASNTRENSEEREKEGEGEVENESRERRLVRRRHGDVTTGEDRKTQNEKASDSTKNESSPSDDPNVNGLYIEDITPAPLPSTIANLPPPIYNNQNLSNDNSQQTKLLLPAHVSVLGSTPVEILPEDDLDEDGDKDYIKYLDYEVDRHEFLRYFEEPEDESIKLKRTVCKNCGAEGDHKTANCRILICLTCGARDEHTTKSCPVSKVCFSCGMKGHINSNCPNRHMNRVRNHESLDYCDRCSSELHQTKECPTWWRLYLYVEDDDRNQILEKRRSRRDLELGKGGEGYIAEDEWCYNCGEAGHWGDDCEGSKRYDKPDEPSAFGFTNISKGPFYNPKDSVTTVQHERRIRDWERDDDQFGDWGKHAPNNVGKQGRKKMMERMKKSARRFEEESDPEDWFRRAKNRGATSVPTQPRLMREGVKERPRDSERQKDRDRDRAWERRENDGDRGRRRSTDHDQDREHDRRRDTDNGDRGRGRDKNPGRDRHRERERDRDKDRSWDRGEERDKDRERNQVQDEGQRRHPNEGSKVKIKFSSVRIGQPPLHPSLPSRPPSLLARLSDAPQEESQPLSIKGAGKKRSRDDRRKDYHPQYRGGYS